MSLPDGWIEATIGEFIGGTRTLDPSAHLDEKFELFSVPSYSDYRPETLFGREIGSAKQLVQQDDVLLCKIVPHIRRGWKVPAASSYRQIASGEWIVFRDHGLDPEYIRRFVLCDGFHEQFMRTVSGVGGSLMRARPSEAANIPFPVAPLAEQRRIVAKLAMLTARLSRARAELERVVEMAIELRRKSVVVAFSGALTTRSRELNGDKAATDAELDIAYKKIVGTTRRKPPAPIDWKPSIVLPATWRWVSVDQIVAMVQYGTSAKTNSNMEGVPVLRMGNIQDGKLDWQSLKYLPRDHPEFPALKLHDGDVLFNRTNSFELVGKTAVYRNAPAPASFASYLIRLQTSAVLPELLSYYLNSSFGRRWVESTASQQVGQANVNGSKLKALGFPLPPDSEQREIVSALDMAFARADRMEAEAARARALLDRLEASILARAFRGELVPQDPDDEPASVLLDRIRSERAAAPRAKRGRMKRALSATNS